MANIALFDTPDSDDALQQYIKHFQTPAELKAAEVGYNNYELILKGGQLKVENLLLKHGIDREQIMLVVTVAGLRWNLLDKQNDNDPTRNTELSNTSN